VPRITVSDILSILKRFEIANDD